MAPGRERRRAEPPARARWRQAHPAVATRLTRDDLARLDAAARRLGCSRAAALRAAVRLGLDALAAAARPSKEDTRS